MKKLDELAHLLAKPGLPKASRPWGGAHVVIALGPQADPFRNSFYPSDRQVRTEHALEVSYFFEILRDALYEEALIDHCSKFEFFGRLATAADACLLDQPDASAHLVCAAVLREAYAIARQIRAGEFDFLTVAEGNQIAEDLTRPGMHTGYSSVQEMIEFFHGIGIRIHGTV
jgi:hypothetical protein